MDKIEDTVAEIEGADDVLDIGDVSEESPIEDIEEGKEPSEEVEEEIPEEEEEEIPEDEEEEETSEEEEEVKEEKLSQDSLDSKETANQEYREAQIALVSINDEFENLRLGEKPTPPQDDLDEDAKEDYRISLALWKSRQEDNKDKKTRLIEKMRSIAKKAEKAFVKDFPGVDFSGFENWVKDRPHMYLAWTSGDETLYSLYSFYLNKTGNLQTKKEVAKLKKSKVKIKPVSLKNTSVVKKGEGNNGINAKYKYANMKAFKDLVADFKQRKVDRLGNRFTDKYIDDLCKQEYLESKGYSLI